jgi:peptidoglycan LD-endopeptidase LytH
VMPISALFDGVTPAQVVASGSGPLFVCPVDAPRSYSDDFGAPRYAGGFHLHQGNDIFAVEGTPIRAPFDGTAVDTSNVLGGYAVSVYGADGYVYNAHLVRFGRLGEVHAGDVIGFVGNTGDADASAPHDHFEWHPGNGPALDPYPYLNAVC